MRYDGFGRRFARGRIACGVVFLIVLPNLLVGCGYRVRSSVRKLPSGVESLGIPTFQNHTPEYKLEQRLSSALIKEFSTRTRIPISSNSAGVDAALLGEIISVSSSPVTFGGDTYGSAFLITVQISAKLVRLKDSAVLWEDDNFLYRERYVLNSNIQEFFFEANPALDRLARAFAASLASTILNR